MARSAGVDYGQRRIGLALSDYGERIASPAEVIASRGGIEADAQAIVRWAIENEVTTLVVGLPLNMNDTSGPQAEISHKLVAALRKTAPTLRVELQDERLSSFQADQFLDQAEKRRAKRRSLRDALAAQVILQAYLNELQQSDPKP